MKGKVALTLVLLVLCAFLLISPQPKLQADPSEYEMSWLGYELTDYMKWDGTGNHDSITMTGANYTLQGVWGQRLNSFKAYYPTLITSGVEQSVGLGVSFGGFFDDPQRVWFIRNSPVVYAEKDHGPPQHYYGYHPYDSKYYGYYDAYLPVMVATVNVTKTVEDPPHETDPFTFWVTTSHLCNVTWDESRSCYLVENASASEYPYFIFGTLSDFKARHMSTYADIYPWEESFWWNVYLGGDVKTGWAENDTGTFLCSNETERIDMGLQFYHSLDLGESYNFTIIVAFGSSIEEALSYYDTARTRGATGLLDETVSYWRDWLNAGPALSSSDLPWLNEYINHTLLNMVGSFWRSPEGFRGWSSWDMYRAGHPVEPLFFGRAFFLAEHYQDYYSWLKPNLDAVEDWWGTIRYPNDWGFIFGYYAVAYYELWRAWGNDTAAEEIYHYFKNAWNNMTQEGYGWDSTHNLYKNRAGLDYELRYYSAWAGDTGWYTGFNFMNAQGLHDLSLMADYFGYTSDAELFENYSQLIFTSLDENMWNGTNYVNGRYASNWTLARGWTLITSDVITYDGLTPRHYVNFQRYLENWWEDRNIKFPYMWEQDSGGTEQNAIRTRNLNVLFDMFLVTSRYDDWRNVMDDVWEISTKPAPIWSENVNVSTTNSNSGNPGFDWGFYIGPNALRMAERHSNNMVYLRPAIDFTIQYPDGAKLIVTRHGDDNYPLTEYAINGSRVQVTSWDREINFTVSAGETYEVDVYFGSRPALTNRVEQLEFFNRTEVWNSATKELNVTFLDGLPASDRGIVLFCEESPSSIENGTLIRYADNLATISVAEASLVIIFAPVAPPAFFVWGVFAAGGGGGLFAYWLYRRKRK